MLSRRFQRSCALAVFAALFAAHTTHATLIEYLRFEEGTPGTLVYDQNASHTTLDSSGNGNNVAAFAADTSPAFSAMVPASAVPGLAAPNTRSVNNTAGPGGGNLTRDLYTLGTGSPDINAHLFSQFTIEASVNFASTGGFQTFVGKDRTDGAATADLYFQKPGDASGFSIRAKQADGTFVIVNGATAMSANRWYNLAAVADGSTLKLFLQQEVGGPYVLDGMAPFVGGLKSGSGTWTVGRGQYNGNPADQAFALIDEVRISDTALSPSQFLFASVPGYSTVAEWNFRYHDAGGNTQGAQVMNMDAAGDGDIFNSAPFARAEDPGQGGHNIFNGTPQYKTYNIGAEGLVGRTGVDGFALSTENGAYPYWLDNGSELELATRDNSTFSVFVRAKRTSDTNDSFESLVSRPNRWRIGVDGDGTIAARFGGVDFDTGVPFNVGEWHDVAFTYDGTGAGDGTVNIFVDGALAGMFAPGAFDINDVFHIGDGPGGSESFAGLFDRVLFYNEVLSANDISALTSVPVPEPATAMVGLVGIAGLLRRRRRAA